MRISIDQQLASIGINMTPSQLHIKLNRPEMTLEQSLPQLTVDHKAPSFKVNWDKVYSESGLMPPDDFMISISSAGKNAAMNAIAQTSDEGELLGKTEQQGNRVAQLGKQITMKTASIADMINIGSMPKSMPEVSWDPGYMTMSWSEHTFDLSWEGEYMPEMKVDPRYSIEVFLRDKPYISIKVEEVPILPGQPGYLVNEVR